MQHAQPRDLSIVVAAWQVEGLVAVFAAWSSTAACFAGGDLSALTTPQ